VERPHFSAKTKVFYGYWIVAVAFFCLLIFSGCAFYAFSLFTHPLQIAFGWSRGQVMVAYTALFLTMGASAPFIGRFIERYGVRRVIIIGAAVGGLGFALLSQMHSLWQFYASYALVGIGMAGMGVVPSATVVSNWFKERRGTALGIMGAGIGAGGILFPRLVGTYLIPNFGWSMAYQVLAVFVWIVIPPALFVIRTKPSEMRLQPYGVQASEVVNAADTPSLHPERFSLKKLFSLPIFWLIAVSYLVSGISVAGISQSQVPYLMDIGFSSGGAALTLTGVGVGSLIGKFGFGWLCDRIQAKYAWSIACGFGLIAIIILLRVETTTPTVIMWVYAISLGLAFGGWLSTMSVSTSSNFGLASYATVFGWLMLAQSSGIATGPLVAGYLYDTMGTYRLAFIIFIILYLVAIALILATRRPKSLPNLNKE